MRRVGRGIPASLTQGPSDNVGSTSFSFDALQALGERLAMKETQYSNTPPLQHSSCRITIVSGGQTGRGPGGAGLGFDAQRGMRGMVPEGPPSRRWPD